jgi:hypothetical protein
MLRGISVALAVALLAAGVAASFAIAGVDVGPGAANSQIAQYVEGQAGTGQQGAGGGGGGQSAGGGQSGGQAGSLQADRAPVAQPSNSGAGGELAFTGLLVLPLALIGVALILGALAIRRRTSDSPATI